MTERDALLADTIFSLRLATGRGGTRVSSGLAGLSCWAVSDYDGECEQAVETTVHARAEFDYYISSDRRRASPSP